MQTETVSEEEKREGREAEGGRERVGGSAGREERVVGKGRGAQGDGMPCGREEGRGGCVPGREGVMAVAETLSVQLALCGEGRVVCVSRWHS